MLLGSSETFNMSYWKVHTQNKVKAWLIGPEKVQATFIFRQFITYIYSEKTNRPKVPAPWVLVPHTEEDTKTKGADNCTAGVAALLQLHGLIFCGSSLKGPGQKAPYLIRSQEARKHCLMTGETRRQGGDGFFAPQRPLLWCSIKIRGAFILHLQAPS